MSLIKVENISTGYTKEKIIENISFSIESGELIGVLGENGSGKSTLAKAVCNILPHTGKTIINNSVAEDLKISQIARIISYIPQHSGINIDISVFDVVMMGFNSQLNIFEKPSSDMKNKALEVMTLLGLGDKLYTNYMLLSEGQKQLTILARALVNDNTFLVMDEPESALDFNVRYNMMKIIKDRIKSTNCACMIILHDVMLALNNCDRILLLKDKHIIDIIDLNNDSLKTAENKLKLIYGDISLLKVNSNNGKDNVVMLFNSEDS